MCGIFNQAGPSEGDNGNERVVEFFMNLDQPAINGNFEIDSKLELGHFCCETVFECFVFSSSFALRRESDVKQTTK